jgi:hypothetical protein
VTAGQIAADVFGRVPRRLDEEQFPNDFPADARV